MMMMMMMISLCRMDTEVLMLNILNSSSIIVLSQVVLGRPTGLLQSVGGRTAAVHAMKFVRGIRAPPRPSTKTNRIGNYANKTCSE